MNRTNTQPINVRGTMYASGLALTIGAGLAFAVPAYLGATDNAYASKPDKIEISLDEAPTSIDSVAMNTSTGGASSKGRAAGTMGMLAATALLVAAGASNRHAYVNNL